MHRQMEGRVVPFDGFNELADLDLGVQLLPYFTDQSLLRAFSGLDLASREFPPILPLAISALGREDLSISDYYSRYDFDFFSYSILLMPS